MHRRTLFRKPHGRSLSVSRCGRLGCECLEDRTTPSVASLDAVVPAPQPTAELAAPVILIPIPTIVAGVSPDSPTQRIDANTADSEYGGVVGILIHSTLGDYLCSGTAISPTHILTAAHCLDVDDNGDTSEILGFTVFVNNGSSPSQTIDAVNWEVHPDWTGFNNPSINDDLGIITLAEPLEESVPIYPLYTGNILGKTLELVGYGTTGTPSGYIAGTAGVEVKRLGVNVVGALVGQDDPGRPAAYELWRADFDGSTSTTNTLNDGPTLGNAAETTLGGGDSGGPAFVRVNNGAGDQLYLAGVNTHTAAVLRGFFQIQ